MTSRPDTSFPLRPRTRSTLQQSTSLVSFPSANFYVRRRMPKRLMWSPYRPHGCFSRPDTGKRKSLERSPKDSWETLRLSKVSLEGSPGPRRTPSPIRAYHGKRSKYTYYTPTLSLRSTETVFPTVLSLKGKSERINSSPSRQSPDSRQQRFPRNSDCGSNTEI